MNERPRFSELLFVPLRVLSHARRWLLQRVGRQYACFASLDWSRSVLDGHELLLLLSDDLLLLGNGLLLLEQTILCCHALGRR